MNQTIKLLNSVTSLDCNNLISQIATASNVFTALECEKIISLGMKLPAKEGLVEQHDPSGNSDFRQSTDRDSKIRFLMPDSENIWLFDRLDACLAQVNQAYNFDLLGFYEGAQIASYGERQHYDWHMDLGQELTSSRKLSISVQLSSADDYEGGNLEFMCAEGSVPRGIGSVVVFPSFLTHRVTPVTTGTRWSMVSWIHGQPYR